MSRLASLLVLGAFLGTAANVTLAAAPSAELAGTWLLVEQTYGNGSSNLADALEPIRLRIERDAKGPLVRIWQGAAEDAASEWPAMIAQGRALPSSARSVTIDASGSTLAGRCRVVPVEGEPLELDIRETYALSADGKSLAGTVEVTFVHPDGAHGGYTLHRKFERER